MKASAISNPTIINVALLPMKQVVLYNDLGKNREYKEVWDLQERILQQNVQLKSQSKLQLVEDAQKDADNSTTNYLFLLNITPFTHWEKAGI